jgi:peptidoglycan/LPS O-acetylase OafA/YrhL
MGALLYVANRQLIFEHRSYFETVGRPPLLQHLWSLAIEEQFYLLWPIFLVLGLRRFKRPMLLGMVLASAVASSLLMAVLHQPDADPTRVYYGTDTRAGGLLAGAALAFLRAPRHAAAAVHPWLLDTVGLAALGALVVASLKLSNAEPMLYRGGFALVDLLTTVLLVVIVEPRARLVSGALW